ncbi:MAG: PKD domain-containing protein [Bacteroidetes bacterium]|nr:PKD domain-containing protein [Bacteroidota bacterium]
MRKYLLIILFLTTAFTGFNQTQDCHADFVYVLDSNGAVHNSFFFYDYSTGNPDSWLWTFGDGTSSMERNPVHYFHNSGTYSICLKIWKISPEEKISCLDSICKEIHTAHYYNLGGLLFAGIYPINNPVNTGDTGMAILYRVTNSYIYATDTSMVTFLGYYSFPAVLEGNYMVKARLTGFSLHYKNFIPGYFDNQLRWKSAKVIAVNGGPNFNDDIHLIPAKDSMTGNSILRGSVINTDNRDVLPGEEVVLLNDSLQPLVSAYTDENGRFEFIGLPFGNYKLFAEMTAKYSAIVNAFSDESHPLNDTLLIPVSSNSTIGINGYDLKGQTLIGKVFPNPATEHVRFISHLKTDRNLILQIYSYTAREVYSSSIPVLKGEYLVTIPIQSLGNGLYLLVVSDPVNGRLNAQKFVKY